MGLKSWYYPIRKEFEDICSIENEPQPPKKNLMGLLLQSKNGTVKDPDVVKKRLLEF